MQEMDADANNDDDNESVPDPDLSFFEVWEVDGNTNTFDTKPCTSP